MKILKITWGISLLFICFGSTLWAQEHEHEHESESALELITSGLVSFSPSEDETNYGTEIHLTYWFNPKWGGGLSYSAKFDDDKAFSDIALLGSYNPARWLTINTGPNFALPNGEKREKLKLGLYAETEFNWRISETFHCGIFTGTVLSEEVELSAGIHLGFEFPLHKHKHE